MPVTPNLDTTVIQKEEPQLSSMQPPGPHPGLERRKSVKDLVTDFSSCLYSPEENTMGEFGETVTRRKKKKRKASNSPTIDSLVIKEN